MSIGDLFSKILGPFNLDFFSLPRDDEITKKTLFWFTFFMILWFVLYFFVAPRLPMPSFLSKKLKTKEDRFYVGYRLICMVSGTTNYIIPMYWVLFEGDYTCGKYNTDFEIILTCSIMAVFIWDLVFMQYYNFLDTGNFIHHFMGIVAYSQGLFFQHNLYQLVPHLAFAEVTNVNMHVRDVYRRMGWRYTWSYYCNEYIYSAIYMFARTILIPACYYYQAVCPSTNPIQKVLFILHIFINFYYVVKFPNLVAARNKERKQLRDKKLVLKWFEPISSEDAKGAGIRAFEIYKM
jgi:hypothetical protein